MSTDSRTTLEIAVLTFRRPGDIEELLPLLVDQARSVADRTDARVLVVDNDPDGGAADAVAAAAARTDVAVRYLHEPVPGISAARNRALAGSADADLLVFIDDDERPGEHWLRDLLGTRERFGADVVAGAVESAFEVEPDPWIRAGGFFDRRRPPTGTPIVVAATNNLLLDLRLVRRLGLEFDPALGLTGGEDSLFTRRLHAAGAVMVWCDEAVVVDRVPAARTTRRWVLARAYSSGNARALTAQRLAPDALHRTTSRLRSVAEGGTRLVAGSVRALTGRIARRADHHARGMRTARRGAGMMAGALGLAFEEYGRS